MNDLMISIEDLFKTFVLHTQENISLPVLRGFGLEVRRRECVVLAGPSGAGKSTVTRSIYGNYKTQAGHILVNHEGTMTNMTGAHPHQVLEIRNRTIGYVSQFLRVIPRVSTLRLVCEPLRAAGVAEDAATKRAASLLARLRIPEKLWNLAPATFSGGEQQRVNIARSMIVDYPILLLDEPTASLDFENRETVVQLIGEARERGTAMVGIFHDQEVRDRVATRVVHLESLRDAA